MIHESRSHLKRIEMDDESKSSTSSLPMSSLDECDPDMMIGSTPNAMPSRSQLELIEGSLPHRLYLRELRTELQSKVKALEAAWAHGDFAYFHLLLIVGFYCVFLVIVVAAAAIVINVRGATTRSCRSGFYLLLCAPSSIAFSVVSMAVRWKLREIAELGELRQHHVAITAALNMSIRKIKEKGIEFDVTERPVIQRYWTSWRSVGQDNSVWLPSLKFWGCSYRGLLLLSLALVHISIVYPAALLVQECPLRD